MRVESGISRLSHAARDVRAAMKHLGLDTVEDHVDLGLILGGEQALLVVRRAVTQAAVIQVQENHRVARSGAEEVARLRREVGTEVEVGAVGMIEVLEVVHHRHARESLGKIERRAEPAVADDQVGIEVGH